ncbi:hypothetical protein [Commensalibacter communis]|uniref:hypothetical protein n=1 Tax=Commensalibacter communis TaxID=2972786 RepID=UPI0023309AC9|nr:hypothetical protein [Commensalibacter communis]
MNSTPYLHDPELNPKSIHISSNRQSLALYSHLGYRLPPLITPYHSGTSPTQISARRSKISLNNAPSP